MVSVPQSEIEALADEIAVSAATLDAAMHTFLSKLRRFDELRGWARQGAKSCAYWLSWRIGDGIIAAREKVRVARALADLPLVDEALKRGELSYAKVRAITRVARPGMEKLLLQYATHSTGAQLERICRGYRNVAQRCESGRKALTDDGERYVRFRRTESGMVRLDAQLTADEADLVYRALAEARAKKEADKEKSLADALVTVSESFLATGPRARTGGERTQIFVHLSKDDSSESWRAQLADGSWLSGNALMRLACDAGIVMAKVGPNGEVLDVGRKLRTVSPALLRALQIRDGGCQFPGCTHRAYVEGHHVEHWAHGGPTNLDNTVLLCGSHHRDVHEGLFHIVHHEKEIVFLDRERRVIPKVGPPASPAPTDYGFDAKTNRPHSQRRFDYPAAVEGLLRRAGINIDGPWRTNDSAECKMLPATPAETT